MTRRTLISLICIACLLPFLSAMAMQSSNYYIGIDSINFSGNYSTSSSYGLQDTLGEQGTGNSSSANYALKAGYQQMYSSYIALSASATANMPQLSGISAGVSTTTIPANVITDNPAGYVLSVQASASPALQATSGASFADYVPVANPSPDYSFTIASTTSAFGFSVFGTDVLSRYKNNGSACNTGSLNTLFTCFDGFSTSSQNVAQSTGPNNPSGTQTTIGLEAAIGSYKIQDAGTYTATITITAATL